MDLAGLRISYERGALDEASVPAEPSELLRQWLADAVAAGQIEPNAMSLATADEQGVPSVRFVLLKGIDDGGFVFYTNYLSRKGREIAANSQVAVAIHWDRLERQVRACGHAHPISREQSEAYFRSRPRGSQLGAIVSLQSEVVPGRDALERRLTELEARYGDGPLPMPENWGGYRVAAAEFEFWQGRPNRLHDRIRYRRDGATWRIDRLSP